MEENDLFVKTSYHNLLLVSLLSCICLQNVKFAL